MLMIQRVHRDLSLRLLLASYGTVLTIRRTKAIFAALALAES